MQDCKKRKKEKKERSWSEREEGGKLGIGKMPQRNSGSSKTNVYLVTMQHEASHLKECTINQTIWRLVATTSLAKHNLRATRAHVKPSGDRVALTALQEHADVQSQHILFSQSMMIA